MMNARGFSLLLITVAWLVAARQADAQRYVLGVDSTNKAAHLFSATDGSLIQTNFLDWSAVITGSSTGKDAIQVGDEIWVSDQIADVIMRFDLTGSYVGSIGNTGLDNIKGMEVVGNQVWVTNAGTNNSAPGNAIVFVDIGTASVVGSKATNGSLFDLLNYQGNVLGSNIGNDDLEFYDSFGNYVSTFHNSDGTTGIDFPQQMYARRNGNLLAAGFSTPAGIFEYSPLGVDLGVVAGAGSGTRGILELDNGQLMWTSGSGFFVGSNTIFATSGQYLTFVDLSTIPEPGSCWALLALVGAAAWWRRRSALAAKSAAR